MARHVTAENIGLLREGTRNDGLTRLGGYLRRKGWERPAIETELLRQNLRRCRPPLPDVEVRTIADSVSRYAPGGPDLLETAFTTIQKETHNSSYEQFASLFRELQRIRPGHPVVLPLQRIAGLMGCVWESVRGYRQQAMRAGLLYQVSDPIPHRRAAEYRVTLTEPPTLTTMGTNAYCHHGNCHQNHDGDGGNGGNELSGKGWE